eukprot:g62843.t1
MRQEKAVSSSSCRILSWHEEARRRREQERQRQDGGARKRRQEQEKVGQSMTIKQMKAFLTAHNADLSDWTKKKTFWNAWKLFILCWCACITTPMSG